MATVKGDVHDIGKNIVGVVLGCNNYEVIDLGVMVPCDKILETAIDEKADIDRPVGLITPSLDEMVHVAKEMERRGLRAAAADRRRHHQPAAHGGQDRARVQRRPTVHVLDASRAVGVVASLLDAEQQRGVRRAEPRRAGAAARAARAASASKPLLPLRRRAHANRLTIDWRPEDLAAPAFLGRRVLDDVPLAELVPYIDWTFFFTAWELQGQVPGDPRAPAVRRGGARAVRRRRRSCSSGSSTRSCSPRARRLRLLAGGERRRRHRPLHATRRATRELLRFHMLRQQQATTDDKPYLLRSPTSSRRVEHAACADHVGAFAVTAGHRRRRARARASSSEHDDYNAIMVKALADRLAEAFAECLHAARAPRLGLRRGRAARRARS